MGSKAGFYTATGAFNTFLGYKAGYYNTIANNNVFVGAFAGTNTTNGDGNTLVGYSAGQANTTGASNTFLGFFAGATNSTGKGNTFLGNATGLANSTGENNTFVGREAGYLNTTGSGNTYLGYQSGSQVDNVTQNTYVGFRAGYQAGGSANTIIGHQAGPGGNGTFNTFIGVQAGLRNSTGSSNVMIGVNAGANNVTGNANFFLGDNAGGSNTTGYRNVYLGINAGNGPGVNGIDNTAIGFEAGKNNSGGNNNLFLGNQADASASNLTNATAIGPNAKVGVSNAVVLGDQANVGIGTSAPTARLEINSGAQNTAGIKLTSLTSNSTPSSSASKFLTVDGSGNVILANYAAGAREGVTENLWQRNGSFLQSTKGEAIIVGSGVTKTPTGYSLFVGQGLLAEKVKVAVRNTGEWSDYVFKPGYNLRPLSEVATYVAANGHLPGVPTAQQMVEQGNDLHRTDAKLLEKIEELTLYSIQLEKANQQLQRNDQKQQAELDELKRLVRELANHR